MTAYSGPTVAEAPSSCDIVVIGGGIPGLAVPRGRLRTAMEDWFRRKGYSKPGDRLLVTEAK